MPGSDDELDVPSMAGFGTAEVPRDGSGFEAYRFPAPTRHEHAEPVARGPEHSGSSMATTDLAKAMEVLSLLNQSGWLQQMVQEIEHHDGSFTHARQTHESRIAPSSTNPFQSVPWRSNVTYATPPQPYIHGEPIVHGVPTGVQGLKFSKPLLLRKRVLSFCRPCNNSGVVLET